MKTRSWYGFTVLDGNVPQKRAGIYSITHINSGRVYIGISGNLEKRVREHGRPGGSESKVGRAISALGAENFLVTPLYHTLDNSADGLTRIETDLISLYDSISNGFNIIANSSRAGKRGEAFCRAAKAGQNTPEAIARRREILNDPEMTRKRGDAIRAGLSRPEAKMRLRSRPRTVMTEDGLRRLREAQTATHSAPEMRARKSDAMRRNHSDPDFKNRHLSGVRKANADPERNSKISESRKGGIWITNGIDDRFVRSDAVIPEGWYRGRIRNRKAA